MFLGELTKSVKTVRGVGEAAARDLSNLSIITVSDLLTHYPRDYEDRITIRPFRSVLEDGSPTAEVNTVARVLARDYIGWGKKKTLKVLVEDDTGQAALLCFGRNFLANMFAPGKSFFIYGKFTYKYGEIQSSSFEVEPASSAPKHFNRIIPIYPLSGNLSQGLLRRIVHSVLKEYGAYIDEELPSDITTTYDLLPKRRALHMVHFPETLELKEQALTSLKFEELFYFQLAILKQIAIKKEAVRKPVKTGRDLQNRLKSRLPFSLTTDQKTVLEEINTDLAKPVLMTRLLQGDVGSGKTLIALLATLPCIEAGFQVAFMAPTELLARQHAATAARLLEPLGVRVAILTGSLSNSQRQLLLTALQKGDIDLLMGTQALFSESVTFVSLGLVIVDEQQRFGVLQRLSLLEKSSTADLLMMTATPIPRTLALTVFGDLDVSTIKTLPPGRKPVETHLAKEGNEQKVYRWIEREVQKGRQAYFVYPLIEESEVLRLKSAEAMYENLRNNIFPNYRLGLIHSKVGEEEKLQTMQQFVEGKIDILVSTSVVEVGVDVPNATCMVVEHADRFGLSALHQLRGRVGRGDHQSYTFLVFSSELTEAGKKRLMVMKECNDGFLLSEEDLSIRGPGEVTGIKQSGEVGLSIADIFSDRQLLIKTREVAKSIVEQDKDFTRPEYSVIREVLSRCPPFSGHFIKSG